MLEFSNPRLVAEFDDWPSGGERVKCRFEVEAVPKKGYRTIRTTTKRGVWCKPKKDTFGGKTAIVDGSDGKTYILKDVPHCGFCYVLRHDFMQENAIHKSSNPEEYAKLVALIEQAY